MALAFRGKTMKPSKLFFLRPEAVPLTAHYFPLPWLWCFVLNPHRRSPYPNSQLELRDELRVSCLDAPSGRPIVEVLIVSAALLLPLSPLPPPSVWVCEPNHQTLQR